MGKLEKSVFQKATQNYKRIFGGFIMVNTKQP